MIHIDPGTLSGAAPHRLLTSLFVPRPIAFVGTLGPTGVPNVAPFSFAAGVSSQPPVMMVAISDRKGEPKDTLRNIQATGEFTINIVTEPVLEPMHRSSFPYPADQSEFEQVGLTVRPSRTIRAPGVAECPITMELRLRECIPVEGAATTMVLGNVVLYTIDESVWDGQAVDALKLQPVARLGQDAYAVIRDVVRLPPVR